MKRMDARKQEQRILVLEANARKQYGVDRPDGYQVKQTVTRPEFEEYDQLIEHWNHIVMEERLNPFYLRHKNRVITTRKWGWNYYEFPAHGYGELSGYGEWDFAGGNSPQYQREIPWRCVEE